MRLKNPSLISLIAAGTVLLLETLFQGGFPLSSPYFQLLFSHLPGQQLKVTLASLAKVLGWYWLLAATLDLLLRLTVRRFWFFRSPWVLFGLFSLFCFSLTWLLTYRYPMALDHYASFWPWPLALLALTFFGVGYQQKTKTPEASSPSRVFGAIVLVAWVAFGIFMNASPKAPLVEAALPATKPSFVLFSFDSVPGEFFTGPFEDGPSPVPLWQKHWAGKSVYFNNAYSLTNSTFTSWFSILSGQHPLHSGVETLFPNPREGAISAETLLPKRLEKLGYETVFLTDCSTTSYMKPEYGFQTLVQDTPGGLACERAAVVSSHLLTALATGKDAPNLLFPENDHFCSSLQRGEVFFEKVRKTLERVAVGSKPYFVAIHSCLTHRDVHQARATGGILPAGIPIGLPANAAEKAKALSRSLALADKFLHQTLQSASTGSRRPWIWFFSDHGVRIEGDLQTDFTHALGEPVNRYQYHVPLALIPPDQKGMRPREGLVSLLDIYPSIVELTGLQKARSDGESLIAPLRGASVEARSDRKLLLLSAASTADPRRAKETWWPLLKEGIYFPDGTFSFSVSQEKDLHSKRSVALLSPPYRLLLSPNRMPALFHEWDDPAGLNDLSLKKTAETKKLALVVCKAYPQICRSVNASTRMP